MTDQGTAGIEGTEAVTDLTCTGGFGTVMGVMLSVLPQTRPNQSQPPNSPHPIWISPATEQLCENLPWGQGDDEEEERVRWKAGCAEEQWNKLEKLNKMQKEKEIRFPVNKINYNRWRASKWAPM